LYALLNEIRLGHLVLLHAPLSGCAKFLLMFGGRLDLHRQAAGEVVRRAFWDYSRNHADNEQSQKGEN
jgi:hypothetical protein